MAVGGWGVVVRSCCGLGLRLGICSGLSLGLGLGLCLFLLTLAVFFKAVGEVVAVGGEGGGGDETADVNLTEPEFGAEGQVPHD